MFPVPRKSYLPYCVSKAAVIALTKSLAIELGPEIQVNAIAPGPILPPENETSSDSIIEKIPLKRWGGEVEIVKSAMYLIDSDFSTGSTLYVDGGASLV